MAEMSAVEVTDRLVQAIESASYDFILVNYANPDMVGHTGILSATIQAIETMVPAHVLRRGKAFPPRH